jgi:uncharacterized membrane protein
MAWMRPFGVGLVVLLVLDFIWLGVLMSGFYRRGLGQIARTAADGSLSPVWAAAAPVYLLIVAGLIVFALARPEATTLGGAVLSGALFGLITYGVYDFTNLSTLRGYPLQLALVDTTWGAVLCGLTAAAMRWAMK